MQRHSVLQRPANDVQIWDRWNSAWRQGKLTDEPCLARLSAIGTTMDGLGIRGAKILEVGCGTGWLSAKLSEFGDVTACDLGSEIIETAQKNYPWIRFLSGDAETLDLPSHYFDILVCSEVLAHVPDQPAFIRRLAELVKEGGLVIITTQNKYVFDRIENIPPPEGWIRQWVTMRTLKTMLRRHFSIRRATTLEPVGHLGFLRVVNSRKVNRYCNAILGADRVKRLKESAGFGQSLYVIAKKRSS
jgi:2-polyprenyl-3-methyl-5-hydroxy-6-metoxy-1,4-benzoquinol methylase